MTDLGIGTVQFGINYGISNTKGQTPAAEVSDILGIAEKADVRVLDTAPAYGASEAVLGEWLSGTHPFDIVTKTPGFNREPFGKPEAAELIRVFEESLSSLRQTSVYGLLVHECDDLFAVGGELLWDTMQSLKDSGRVKKIGVSVYTAEQIDRVMDGYDVDLIQLPINVIDQRLVKSGHLRALKEADIEIHARSVFLQGLLLMNPEKVPSHFEDIRPLLKKYHAWLEENGLTMIEGALAFMHGLPEIDCVVAGVCSQGEAAEIASAFHGSKNVKMNFNLFFVPEPKFLNPSMWPAS